jgi:hypothetical protein
MLFFQTVDTGTIDLLIRLQNLPAFSALRLVGGTALALQLGHRKSIDLDLFGSIIADEYEISDQLAQIGTSTILRKSKNINIYLIEGIKIDIVNYTYKWLENSLTESGFTMAHKKDIAAMKLAAITGRGTKKDFIDIYFLLKEFSLRQMVDFYIQKYSDGSEFLVLKSLSYFADADSDENPVMLKSVTWDAVKSTITSVLKTDTLGK